MDKENESLAKRQQELRERMESGGRELANANEKCRQIQAKANSLSKAAKDSSDEASFVLLFEDERKLLQMKIYLKNKKLQSTIEQRDKQFKHDRKKLEKEIEKLKERVQILSTGKPKDLPRNLKMSLP